MLREHAMKQQREEDESLIMEINVLKISRYPSFEFNMNCPAASYTLAKP